MYIACTLFILNNYFLLISLSKEIMYFDYKHKNYAFICYFKEEILKNDVKLICISTENLKNQEIDHTVVKFKRMVSDKNTLF